MSDIFIPKNPIETAQEFQWGIDMAHPEIAPELARQALDILGDVKEIYGSNRLIIHALSGYIIDRQLTIDEQMLEDPFGEIVVRGYFGGLPFIQKLEQPRLQSFVADMYDVEILEPRITDNPTRKIKPPVILPVLDIQSVMIAA